MNNELYHYGVLGMKWGVRRAERRATRRDVKINKSINAVTKAKQRSDNMYKTAVKGAERRFGNNPKKAMVLKNKKARLKAYKEIGDAKTNFDIARRKAKLDPTYKQSASYKKAKQTYAKQAMERFLFGKEGQIQLHTLRNKGLNERQARGKVLVTNVIKKLYNYEEDI